MFELDTAPPPPRPAPAGAAQYPFHAEIERDDGLTVRCTFLSAHAVDVVETILDLIGDDTRANATKIHVARGRAPLPYTATRNLS
jgi:hypothetical protein